MDDSLKQKFAPHPPNYPRFNDSPVMIDSPAFITTGKLEIRNGVLDFDFNFKKNDGDNFISPFANISSSDDDDLIVPSCAKDALEEREFQKSMSIAYNPPPKPVETNEINEPVKEIRLSIDTKPSPRRTTSRGKSRTPNRYQRGGAIYTNNPPPLLSIDDGIGGYKVDDDDGNTLICDEDLNKERIDRLKKIIDDMYLEHDMITEKWNKIIENRREEGERQKALTSHRRSRIPINSNGARIVRPYASRERQRSAIGHIQEETDKDIKSFTESKEKELKKVRADIEEYEKKYKELTGKRVVEKVTPPKTRPRRNTGRNYTLPKPAGYPDFK